MTTRKRFQETTKATIEISRGVKFWERVSDQLNTEVNLNPTLVQGKLFTSLYIDLMF